MKKSAESRRLRDDDKNYDSEAYEKPSVTVDVAVCAILDGRLKVLLVKRPIPPFKNRWAIPGGFVSIEINESLDAAARRKLLDKTGISGVYMEQLKTYGEPLRDPRMRVITVAYFALLPPSSLPSPAIIAKNGAAWFPLENLPDRLAFDHAAILAGLLARLRGKISYAPIAFSLLETRFTWAELQEAYEIVLGKKLLTPNFRRKLLSMYAIRELREKKATGGRPSALLTFEGAKEF